MQKDFNFSVDCLCLTFWACGAKHEVIGIPAVAQSPKVWIMLVYTRYFHLMPLQCLLFIEQYETLCCVFFLINFLGQPFCLVLKQTILCGLFPCLSSFEAGNE